MFSYGAPEKVDGYIMIFFHTGNQGKGCTTQTFIVRKMISLTINPDVKLNLLLQ